MPLTEGDGGGRMSEKKTVGIKGQEREGIGTMIE